MDPRPLTEQELIDWERWSKRDIKWEGRDVARLLAMVRDLQRRLERSNPATKIDDDPP